MKPGLLLPLLALPLLLRPVVLKHRPTKPVRPLAGHSAPKPKAHQP